MKKILFVSVFFIILTISLLSYDSWLEELKHLININHVH